MSHLIVRARAGLCVAAILKAVKQPVGRRAILHLEADAAAGLPAALTGGAEWADQRLLLAARGAVTTGTSVWIPGIWPLAIAYVHSNPVRRGLVERAADWRWSSAGWHRMSRGTTLRPDPIPPEPE